MDMIINWWCSVGQLGMDNGFEYRVILLTLKVPWFVIAVAFSHTIGFLCVRLEKSQAVEPLTQRAHSV